MEDVNMRDDTSDNNQGSMDAFVKRDARNQKLKENLPFVEKYRPSRLSEIISHEEILATIRLFLEKKSIPHLLFHGPAGTGKTSCIIALAHELYGDLYKSMVLELNASDDRGINVIRDQVKDFCSAKTSLSTMLMGQNTQNNGFANFKLVILDEADMMTSTAQFCLRRVIEKYVKNCRFCIICNNVSKIVPAIQSRCMRFRFCPLKKEQCLIRVKEILNTEKIKFDSDDTLLSAIEIGKGDMRKILNLIESTFMSYDVITKEHIYSSAGLPTDSDIQLIYDYCLNKTFKISDSYDCIMEVQAKSGFALSDLIERINKDVRNDTNISRENKIKIFKMLAKLDYADNISCSPKIILSNVISLIKKIKS